MRTKPRVLLGILLISILCSCGGGSGGGTNNSGSGDSIAPTVPANLSATVMSATQIDLSWNFSIDNVGVTGYKIYRNGAYSTSVTAGTNYSDTGLTTGTQYCYQISAYDQAGNESARCAAVCATPVETWTLRTSNSNMTVNAVAFSGSRYVAVGNQNEVLVSADSVTWSKKTGVKLDDVIWDGKRFVGVVYTNVFPGVYTSTDGVNWTNLAGSPSSVSAIAYSGSLYVAVGDNGTIMTSPDLAAWSTQNSGTTAWLHDVIWEGGKFVAVSSDSILTSPDGITWTVRVSDASALFWKVAWSGSAYVAVNQIGTSYTSQDGITWTANATQGLYNVGANTTGLFAGSHGGQMYSSTDGVTWTYRGTLPVYPNAIFWDGSRFIAAGDWGLIATSPDGITWTIRASGSDLKNIIWTGSKFVAVGSQGIIATSPDGIDWSYKELTYPDYYNNPTNGGFLVDVAVDTGNKMVVGAQDMIYSSADGGSTWSYESLGATVSAYGVLWSGNGFACVTNEGFSWLSPDGAAWNWYATASTSVLNDLIWDGTKYVAVGQGVVQTSADGVNWTLQTAGVSGDLQGVSWSGSKYVAVGGSGNVLTSGDAVNWTAQSSGTSNYLYNVTWTGSEFIAVGGSNTIITSADGITWIKKSPMSTYGNLNGAASNGTRDVVVGDNGVILTLH